MHRLALVTLVVPDYEAGIRFLVDGLGFALTEDTDMGGGKRWVVATPAGGGTGVLVARAATDAQRARVGDQTGGRVAFFVDTADLEADLPRLAAAGATVVDGPRTEVYGRVVVFADPWGNRWDLVERTRSG